MPDERQDLFKIREDIASLKQIQSGQADILKEVKETLKEIQTVITNVENIRLGQKTTQNLFEKLDAEFAELRDMHTSFRHEFSEHKSDVKARLWMIGAITLALLAVLDISLRVFFRL